MTTHSAEPLAEPGREPSVPLRRSNLVDQIHDELHRRITNRLLPAGERVVIDRLAAEFGVSLVPVREALSRLKAERLVTHENNKGYRIAEGPQPLEMRKLFEARIILETGSLEEGFERLTDDTVRELESVNRSIEAGRYGANFESFRSFVEMNATFHRIIVALSENSFIMNAYDTLGYHQRVAQTLFGRGPDNVEIIVAEHRAIIEALRRRDRRTAIDALRRHIRNGMLPYVSDGERSQ